MKRSIALLLALAVCPAFGAILWEQPLQTTTAYVNQQFGDFQSYSSYAVSDVVVPAGGWTVTGGTWFMAQWNGAGWPNGTDIPVVFNVFPLTGTLPSATDDPAAGTSLMAAYSTNGSDATLTLTGLSLYLHQGSYWIGLSPVMDFSSYGQLGFQLTNGYILEPDAWRNPGGGFGYGGDWQNPTGIGATADVAFRLEGEPGGGAIPEPATWMLGLAGMAALAVLRRRA
jgi:MYXO-CTERM domain-containing protein